MKNYGIETHWNGTVYYNIGKCKDLKDAYEKAINDYKWFELNPNINNIKEI